jgi:hypothetical protein
MFESGRVGTVVERGQQAEEQLAQPPLRGRRENGNLERRSYRRNAGPIREPLIFFRR